MFFFIHKVDIISGQLLKDEKKKKKARERIVLKVASLSPPYISFVLLSEERGGRRSCSFNITPFCRAPVALVLQTL